MCAAIINQYTPNSQLYDLKVLHGNTGKVNNLIDALNWCIYNQIDIINMSCGTEDWLESIKIRCTIKKLVSRKIFLIAAGSNSPSKSYPAEIQGVIGVKTKPWLYDKRFYTIGGDCFDRGINIIASSRHICGSHKEYTPMCNSYAAPCITSWVARYLNEYHRESAISMFEYVNKRLQSDSNKLY
jgi:hypothetical protein